MQRDMDLLRLIMLQIEATHSGPNELLSYEDFHTDLQIEGYSPDAVEYHLRLAISSGLLEIPNGAEGLYIIRGLTPAGHDFADSVRDDKIWRLTKDGALAAGGSTVELVTALAKGFIRKKIAEHTGIEM